jgi:hypothetical protein
MIATIDSVLVAMVGFSALYVAMRKHIAQENCDSERKFRRLAPTSSNDDNPCLPGTRREDRRQYLKFAR